MMKDVFIDTNALLLLILGTINKRNIGNHPRLSVYTNSEFYAISELLGKNTRLVSSPNVWTEVDNLCNNIRGDDKIKYQTVLREIIKNSFEKFISSETGVELENFYYIGLTDSIVIELAKTCDILISGDSKMSDYARALGIKVLDLKGLANQRL